MIRNHRFASHLLTMKITRISVNLFFSEEGKKKEDWVSAWVGSWRAPVGPGRPRRPAGFGQDLRALRLEEILSWFNFLILHMNNISHMHKQAAQGNKFQLGPLPKWALLYLLPLPKFHSQKTQPELEATWNTRKASLMTWKAWNCRNNQNRAILSLSNFLKVVTAHEKGFFIPQLHSTCKLMQLASKLKPKCR